MTLSPHYPGYYLGHLERDDFSSNHHLALSCWFEHDLFQESASTSLRSCSRFGIGISLASFRRFRGVAARGNRRGKRAGSNARPQCANLKSFSAARRPALDERPSTKAFAPVCAMLPRMRSRKRRAYNCQAGLYNCQPIFVFWTPSLCHTDMSESRVPDGADLQQQQHPDVAR
jgi:hypothetical protein